MVSIPIGPFNVIMLINFKTLCAGSIVVFVLRLQAQTIYPVTVQLQSPLQHTTYIQDLWWQTPSGLLATLQFNDFQELSVDVNIYVRIKGVGITIESIPLYGGLQKTLTAGSPLVLDVSDYVYLFQSNRIQCFGYSKLHWTQRQALPEGLYSIEMWVVEANSNIILSNIATTSLWCLTQDPPVLQYPADASVVSTVAPAWISFQWSALHLLPVYTTTTYIFSLHKCFPNGTTPEMAVQTTAPIFQQSVSDPYFLYGIAAPALEIGMRYAWRVQIVPTSGNSTPAIFKNNGYSTVFSFYYGDPCSVPASISIHQEQRQRLRVEWSPVASATSYGFRYRSVGDSHWNDIGVDSTVFWLTSFSTSRTYEYQVRSICGSQTTVWSSIDTFRTQEDSLFHRSKCAPVYVNHPLSGNTRLKVNDVFYIHSIPIRILSLQYTGNTFSGIGVITIPLVQVPIRMQLQQIETQEGVAIRGKASAIQQPIPISHTTRAPDVFCVDNPSPHTTPSNSSGGQNAAFTSLFLQEERVIPFWLVNSNRLLSEGEQWISSEGDTLTLSASAPLPTTGLYQDIQNNTLRIESIRQVTLPANSYVCLRSLVDTLLADVKDTIHRQLVNWTQQYNTEQSTLLQQVYRFPYAPLDSMYTEWVQALNLEEADSITTIQRHSFTEEQRRLLSANTQWSDFMEAYSEQILTIEKLKRYGVIDTFIDDHPTTSERVPLYTYIFHQVEHDSEWEEKTRLALCGVLADWVQKVYHYTLPIVLIDLQNW